VQSAASDFFNLASQFRFVSQKSCGLETECGGIMSAISFFGEPAWAFAMILTEKAAITISKAFAGYEISFEDPDIGDALGEVANVLAGDICAKLDAEGIKSVMSLPTVVRGSNVSLLIPVGIASTQLLFMDETESCWFTLVAARGSSIMGRRPGM